MRTKNGVITILEGVKRGTIDILEAAKKLRTIYYNLYEDVEERDPENIFSVGDLDVFLDLGRKIENYPITKEERKFWSDNALEQKDKELKKIRESYQGKISGSCFQALKRLKEKMK